MINTYPYPALELVASVYKFPTQGWENWRGPPCHRKAAWDCLKYWDLFANENISTWPSLSHQWKMCFCLFQVPARWEKAERHGWGVYTKAANLIDINDGDLWQYLVVMIIQIIWWRWWNGEMVYAVHTMHQSRRKNMRMVKSTWVPVARSHIFSGDDSPDVYL